MIALKRLSSADHTDLLRTALGCLSEHGLLIPVTLLGKDGRPALWNRAHR